MAEGDPCTIPSWVLEYCPPDRRAAVDFLRVRLDEAMIREIAEGDYSPPEDHLPKLTALWKGEDWDELHYWYPMEVLELERWSEPENPTYEPKHRGLRAHLKRAFACAVLLATSNFDPNQETLLPMLESALAIGGEAAHAMGRFLTWKLPSLGSQEDRPFFALALAIVVRFSKPDLDPKDESTLARWVAEEELAERRLFAGWDRRFESSPWLFGLSFSWLAGRSAFKDEMNDRWKALLLRVREEYPGGALANLLGAIKD